MDVWDGGKADGKGREALDNCEQLMGFGVLLL